MSAEPLDAIIKEIMRIFIEGSQSWPIKQKKFEEIHQKLKQILQTYGKQCVTAYQEAIDAENDPSDDPDWRPDSP